MKQNVYSVEVNFSVPESRTLGPNEDQLGKMQLLSVHLGIEPWTNWATKAVAEGMVMRYRNHKINFHQIQISFDEI